MGRKKWTNAELIAQAVSGKSSQSRWAAIRELRNRPSKELFDLCVGLTNSTNPTKRAVGVDILAQLGQVPRPFLKKTMPVFFRLLKIENNPTVLMSVGYAIGHNNGSFTPKQIASICAMLRFENDQVMEGLVFALLGIDDPNAIEALIALSMHRLSHIRNWAIFGLGTLSKRNNQKIREALFNRVNDRHQETRLEAILGLAKRKDSRVNEIINKELIKRQYGTLLFDAILETQNQQFLPLLKSTFTNLKDDTKVNPEWKRALENCIQILVQQEKQSIRPGIS